jgi:tetratricopeptide (TPR) repeat protein
MKVKIILMFAMLTVMNGYAQSDKERGYSLASEIDYNPQIGNDGYNDMKEKLRTIESNNTKADACLKSGNDFVKSKKYDEAIAEYTKAIEINSNFKAAYFNRGLVEVVLEQKEKGCLDLRKAAELGEKDANKMIQKYCK